MSDKLTQIIAECTEAIQTGRMTIDECLEQYPEYRAELTDLLLMVAQVRALPRAYPRSEFRQQARGRLLSKLETPSHQGAGEHGPPFISGWYSQLRGWWEQLTPQTVTAGAIALLIGLFAVLLWQGIRGGSNRSPEIVAQTTATATAVSTEAAAPTATVAAPVAETAVPTAVAEGESEEAVVAAAQNENTVYLPMLSDPLMLSAQTAAVEVVQGAVEVQQADGTWAAVNKLTAVTEGQRIRTKPFSSATISFFDGSFATLGPESELSLDTVDAKRPENGFRTVVMTQWSGESDHDVAFRNDGGSLYEVKTPDEGSGIARGTKFKVIFNPGQLARYIVTEGKVDVTGQNHTVSVIAGQVTVLPLGNVPLDPVYSVSGEGEVTATGAAWTIAGQTFQTDEYTVIVGNPQVGDLVHVDGHLLADGGRMADRIVLLRRAVANEFSFSGAVEEIGAAWVVAGQTIVVGDQTVIGDDIEVGDSVRVDGVILDDGVLQAHLITKLEDAPGLPFQFSGLVQTIGGDSWTISGQMIAVNGDTDIDDDVELDDIVSVRGWILEDGTWLATEIDGEDDDDLATFEFVGTVQNTSPWQVTGMAFETRPWTIIGSDISVGDSVRVRGVILDDGTKVAEAITLLTSIQPNVVTFVGVVSGVNPWVVNGITLVTNENTAVLGEIYVGISAVVQAQLQPDGSWVVLSIRPLYPEFGLGCLYLSSPVTTIVNANTIQVRHWQGNIDIDNLDGIDISHVVSLPLCTGWDGTIIVINGGITVIYQPVVVIINDGGGSIPSVPPGCKITGIGNNNPRLKCSNKGSGSKKSS